MYDYLIITSIPAFYKINLYTELAKELNLFVVFISNETSEKRAADFTRLDNLNFKYIVINHGDFQKRKKISSIIKIIKIINSIKYKQLLVGGWDLPEFWIAIFFSKKSKNCLSLESTIHESRISLLKKTIKQLFLNRIDAVFASGHGHKKLLEILHYKNKVFITHGVGIINKPLNLARNNSHSYKKRFLFIGRLSHEKNLTMLIRIFNNLPLHSLTIIGTGPLESQLKQSAKKNINFIGNISNNLLADVFNEHDLLILISKSEPWGLVVEEALYFGLPVIITNNCGASDLIMHEKNGFVLNNDDRNIQEQIEKIDDDIYMKLKHHASSKLINEKDTEQLNVYKRNITENT